MNTVSVLTNVIQGLLEYDQSEADLVLLNNEIGAVCSVIGDSNISFWHWSLDFDTEDYFKQLLHRQRYYTYDGINGSMLKC